VALGALGPAWLVVTATDLALAVAQSWFLVKGVGRHA
jgi:hypothetical protein